MVFTHIHRSSHMTNYMDVGVSEYLSGFLATTCWSVIETRQTKIMSKTAP